jgi:pimeloyl-ACP methyl ester carboxylesterase
VVPESLQLLVKSRGASRQGRFAVRLVTLMNVSVVIFGCGAPQPVSPMSSLHYMSGTNSPSIALLFMPGRRSRADDFAREGFVRAVQNMRLNVELIAADAHLGYYTEGRYRTLPTRLHQDVVLPAMARGRKKVWLVGTSLGAMGSLAYVKRYPETVVGVVLLGPYLGEEPILEEIERAGGLAAWSPNQSVGYEYEVHTWQWLKQVANAATPRRLELYLAYGEHDRYARASHLLAAGLPSDHVLVEKEGEHNWSTWFALWRRLLVCCGHQLESGIAHQIQ